MVEFHYRWHPFYAGCFRQEGREDRAGGAIVRVEVLPGEVIQVAEWMLNRAFCAGMEMGEPQVSVNGPVELHRLLTELGFRQTSRGGLTAIQEARHEGITTTHNIANADPTTEHTVRHTANAWPERCAKERHCRQAGKPSDGRGRRRGEGGER